MILTRDLMNYVMSFTTNDIKYTLHPRIKKRHDLDDEYNQSLNQLLEEFEGDLLEWDYVHNTVIIPHPRRVGVNMGVMAKFEDIDVMNHIKAIQSFSNN